MPTTAAASPGETGHASRAASMSATAAATSGAVGGSECRWRSWSRTEPMSMEWAELGRSSPRISSVEPPPTSSTSTGRGTARERSRTAPENASAASSAPEITSGSTPNRARTPATNTSALLASREADVAQKRMRSTGCSAMRAANSSMAAKVRTSASSARRPVRSTPSPSRTIRASWTETSGSAPINSLIVLVPQSIAATVRRTARPPTSRRAGRAPRRRAGSPLAPGRGPGRPARGGT